MYLRWNSCKFADIFFFSFFSRGRGSCLHVYVKLYINISQVGIFSPFLSHMHLMYKFPRKCQICFQDMISHGWVPAITKSVQLQHTLGDVFHKCYWPSTTCITSPRKWTSLAFCLDNYQQSDVIAMPGLLDKRYTALKGGTEVCVLLHDWSLTMFSLAVLTEYCSHGLSLINVASISNCSCIQTTHNAQNSLVFHCTCTCRFCKKKTPFNAKDV